MLNWALMRHWENWLTVFLMFMIAALGLHIFIDFVDPIED